jgi:hypothetical protein
MGSNHEHGVIRLKFILNGTAVLSHSDPTRKSLSLLPSCGLLGLLLGRGEEDDDL